MMSMQTTSGKFNRKLLRNLIEGQSLRMESRQYELPGKVVSEPASPAHMRELAIEIPGPSPREPYLGLVVKASFLRINSDAGLLPASTR